MREEGLELVAQAHHVDHRIDFDVNLAFIAVQLERGFGIDVGVPDGAVQNQAFANLIVNACLLYTSDAADE